MKNTIIYLVLAVFAFSLLSASGTSASFNPATNVSISGHPHVAVPRNILPVSTYLRIAKTGGVNPGGPAIGVGNVTIVSSSTPINTTQISVPYIAYSTPPTSQTTPGGSGATNFLYTGRFGGSNITLTEVPNQNVESLSDSYIIGTIKNFQTNDPYHNCLNGETLYVWAAPSEYPGLYVVHNGDQGQQCAYLTLTFMNPFSVPPITSSNYAYTANYNGTTVTLTSTSNKNVESFQDSVLVGTVTNFGTNDPAHNCLNSSTLNVWSAPKEYPNELVVHNGDQGLQCAYGTWTFPAPPPSPTVSTTSSYTTINYNEYVYSGVYQGTQVMISPVQNKNVESMPDATLVGTITNFQTNDPTHSCLDGETLNVWVAPNAYPNKLIVHNGFQGSQCAYGTWIIPIPSTVVGNGEEGSNTKYSGTFRSTPASTPTGILTSVPLLINNNEQVPTPSNFEQQVNINSEIYSSVEASNLQNVEFFYGNGTIIPSWLESGNNNQATKTTYWLLIHNPITDFGNITVYMGFASTSTNLFNVQTTGEAPQLSPTYSQYDDGAVVFPTLYQNFAGSSTPAGWTCYNVSLGNGVTTPGSSSPSDCSTNASYGLNVSQVFDSYGNMPAPTNQQLAGIGYLTPNDGLHLGTGVMWVINSYWTADTTALFARTSCAGCYTYWDVNYPSTGYNIYSLYWPSATKAAGYYNYGQPSFIPQTYLPVTKQPITIATDGAQTPVSFNWVRIRTAPPNSDMPSILASTYGFHGSTTTSVSSTTTVIPTTATTTAGTTTTSPTTSIATTTTSPTTTVSSGVTTQAQANVPVRNYEMNLTSYVPNPSNYTLVFTSFNSSIAQQMSTSSGIAGQYGTITTNTVFMTQNNIPLGYETITTVTNTIINSTTFNTDSGIYFAIYNSLSSSNIALSTSIGTYSKGYQLTPSSGTLAGQTLFWVAFAFNRTFTTYLVDEHAGSGSASAISAATQYYNQIR